MDGNILNLLGRILFGGYFVFMGANHFAKKEMIVAYAKSKRVPSPEIAVMFSGILLLVGGIGTLISMDQIAALALVLFLIPVSFKMHAFWAETDPTMKAGDMVQFFKNMGLLGSALMLF